MRSVTCFINTCVECPNFQDEGNDPNFEAHCCRTGFDFDFPDDGAPVDYFPGFCPLTEIYRDENCWISRLLNGVRRDAHNDNH
jgi:hypothetical protein